MSYSIARAAAIMLVTLAAASSAGAQDTAAAKAQQKAAAAAAAAAARRDTTPPPSAKDSVEYRRLRSMAQHGDTTIDFTSLRFLWAQLAPRAPLKPSPKELFERARTDTDERTARAHVDSVLDPYFGNVQAHINAEKLFRARGDSTRANSEATIVRALLRSIGAWGGRSQETPLIVVSMAEVHAYFQSLGLKPKSQGPTKCGENDCLAMTNTDAAGKLATYFVVFMAW